MEHEPAFMIREGIGRSSATSYPEFETFSPENYGHNMMGFHHHHHHPEDSSLPHGIQHPVGAVVPVSTTTGLFAADDMGIPHQETSSVVDMMADLTQPGRDSVVGDKHLPSPTDTEIAHQLKSGSLEVNAELPKTGLQEQGPLPVGDAGCCGLLFENPQGLVWPGLGEPTGASTTATTMETPDSGNALQRGSNMLEVNAGVTPSPPVKRSYPWRTRSERPADSLVVNPAGLPDEPDPSYSVDVDVLCKATDKEIIGMVEAKTEEHYKKVRLPSWSTHVTKVNHILAEKDPTELQEPVCYFTNQRWFPGDKTHHGEWKQKHREVVLTDGVVIRTWSSENFIGLKRTLEFHLVGKTVGGTKTKKTDWLMHEYIPLRQHFDSSLYLSDKLVLHKVFNKNDKQLSQSISNAEDGSWMDMNGEATDELNRSKTAAGKRRKLVNDGSKAPNEPSKVWHDFIKIYDKRPDPGAGAKLLYAACRHCHIVLKADNGTKSLLAHCTSCPCKKDLQPSSS